MKKNSKWPYEHSRILTTGDKQLILPIISICQSSLYCIMCLAKAYLYVNECKPYSISCILLFKITCSKYHATGKRFSTCKVKMMIRGEIHAANILKLIKFAGFSLVHGISKRDYLLCSLSL